jgi:rod shape-determining protein MreD
MINLFFKYTFYFILYVLVQVLILNNVLFFGFINPYLYILFIITLPSTVTRDATLLIGFLLGLIIDIFSGTPGFNAFVTVLIAYIKPFFQKAFGPREEHDFLVPSFATYGVGMFLQYSGYLVLIHHAVFFLIEAGSLFNFGSIIIKTLCSVTFTMLLIVGMEVFKPKH